MSSFFGNTFFTSALARRLDDRLVLPGDPRYIQACAVYNAAIQTRPAAIVYCQSEEEVREVVAAARAEGFRLTVRSSGHNVAGRCMADAAVVIDVSALREISVYPDRIAVGGGATWREFDAVLERTGCGVTGGTVSSTGVAGLTLGGGIGWLLPSFGLACDSLAEARLVIADGSVIEANDADTPDLMWALRGSGYSLGVVTQLRFEPHPLLPIYAGSITISLGQLERWAPVIAEFLANPFPSLMIGPSFLFRDGVAVLSLDIAMHGPSDAERAEVHAIRALPGILGDTLRARPYTSLQTMIDEPGRAGLHSYWTAGYPAGVTPDLIVALGQEFVQSPSPHSILFIENLHGAFTRPRFPTSFPTREPRFSALVTGSWEAASDTAVNLEWIERIRKVLAPHLAPHRPYSNYSSAPSGPVDQSNRLPSIKAQVDPLGLFL